MKGFLWTTFLLSLLLVGCGQSPVKTVSSVTNGPTHVASSARPEKTVIGHLQDVSAGQYDRWYDVTLKRVNKIGKKIGVVTFGTHYPPNAAISQGPGGLDSNVLRTGSSVYEMPGVDPTKALLVEWNGEYVEAVRSTKKAIVLPGTALINWNGRSYKPIAPIDATNVGQALGTVHYHGKTSDVLTVLKFDGSNPSKTVVFRTSTGDYFEATTTP